MTTVSVDFRKISHSVIDNSEYIGVLHECCLNRASLFIHLDNFLSCQHDGSIDQCNICNVHMSFIPTVMSILLVLISNQASE